MVGVGERSERRGGVAERSEQWWGWASEASLPPEASQVAAKGSGLRVENIYDGENEVSKRITKNIIFYISKPKTSRDQSSLLLLRKLSHLQSVSNSVLICTMAAKLLKTYFLIKLCDFYEKSIELI